MLPLRATSGSSGSAGSVAVDENTMVCASMNCADAVVVRAEGDLRLLLGGDVEPEQLLVAADARDVDEAAAVGRIGRPVVVEVVDREVDDFLRLEIDGEDVADAAAQRRERHRLAVGREARRLGLVDRLHRHADLDLARQHVLHDQRALLLGAHEVGQPIALGRPRHPVHRVEALAELHDVREAHVLVEALGQVPDDRAVLGRRRGRCRSRGPSG